jgi:hypothetical protein
MKWKRYILIPAVLVLLSGFIVSCGSVQHHRHGIRSMRATNFVFLRMDNETTRLGLTDAQEEEYEKLKKRVKLEMERDIDRFRRVPDETLMLLDEKDTDLEIIVEDLKERMATAQDVRGKYLDYLVLCLGNTLTKSFDLFQDRIRCGSPNEWSSIGIVILNKLIDFEN